MLQRLVKNVTTPAPAASGTGILSVISPNVRIIGDIVSHGEVHVDGEIDGNITCQILTVGEGARISGEITADSVRVHGDVTGKINAAEVHITRTARMLGDVHHESLEIEIGAYFEGHCMRRPGSQQTELKRIESQSSASVGSGAGVSAQPTAVEAASTEA
jgi:cytoskeletal protein CcmA (bactofilin family)